MYVFPRVDLVPRTSGRLYLISSRILSGIVKTLRANCICLSIENIHIQDSHKGLN